MKVLIGSVINQKSAIFMQFLTGLKELDKVNLEVDFYFIDRKLDRQVSVVLNKLNQTNKKMRVQTTEADIATSKSEIARYAKEHQYDYLFLINSDLVLYPDTLQHLLSLEKEIVSEIFYTKLANQELLPIKYVYDKYQKSYEEINRNELTNYIQYLKTTNLLEVNVVGDCTLFSKKVLQSGVSFELLSDEWLLKELREVCNGVVSSQYSTYTDTRRPAYHIYSDADLYNISEYKESYQSRMLIAEKDAMIQSLIESEDLVCYPIVVDINEKQDVGVIEYFSGVSNSWYYGEMRKIDDTWKVSKLSKKQCMMSDKQQETNNKKKITLVYNRRSGSDTVALYKAMPSQIKEKYDLSLIRENINNQQYFQEIQTSDVLILTDINYIMDKNAYNPNQMIINLWHGFPLKAMFFQDGNATNNGEWSKFWKHFDYMTSYSPLYNQLIHKSMRINPQKFVITGQPRNDYLFNSNSRELLFHLLQWEDRGKKLIFYTPTFRAIREISGSEGNRSWDNLFDFQDFDRDKFQKFLEENHLEVIVKLHPNEEHLYKENIEKMAGIHLLTEEVLEKENVHSYEVMGAADLLITDYSSIYFDYLLLDKPVIFTPTDLDQYGSSRGFLLEPYEDWTPGPKVTTQQDLQKEMIHALEDATYYSEMRKKIKDIVHTYQDNNSCERVWELVESLTRRDRNGKCEN